MAETKHPCGCRTDLGSTLDYCGGPPGHRDSQPDAPPKCEGCGRSWGWVALSGHAEGCTRRTNDAAGEECQSCWKYYTTVYWLPDDVWACITPRPLQEGAGLLCPPCADKRARAAGIDLFWGAGVGEYPCG